MTSREAQPIVNSWSFSTLKEVASIALALVVLHSIIYQYTLFALFGIDMSEFMSLSDYAGVFVENILGALQVMLASAAYVFIPMAIYMIFEVLLTTKFFRKPLSTVVDQWKYQGTMPTVVMLVLFYMIGPTMGIISSPVLKNVSNDGAHGIAVAVAAAGAFLFLGLYVVYMYMATGDEVNYSWFYKRLFAIFFFTTFLQSSAIMAVRDFALIDLGLRYEEIDLASDHACEKVAFVTSDYFITYSSHSEAMKVTARSGVDTYVRWSIERPYARQFMWDMTKPMFLRDSNEEFINKLFAATGTRPSLQ